MNGHVIKGTPIAVDFWKPTKAPEVRLFFLTHLHSDHIQGLTSSWRLPLYTSPINAMLLKELKKIPDSIIQILEVDQTYLIPMDSDKQEMLSVTPLEANHIPGAVMFLFQGYFGNILYSGDMRWYEAILENTLLNSIVDAKELDIVYLDNTFCAPYCIFPSREGATKQIIDIIDSYPDHIIKLVIRKLGKEDLLVTIAKHYQERVLVSPDKYKMLQMLRYPDVFTTVKAESRIHAIEMTQFNNRNHMFWNREYPTISIVNTALFMGWPNGPYSSQAERGIFVVPYSDHSSYAELEEMVRVLAPRRLIPIVTQWSKGGWWGDPNAPDQTVKANMEVFNNLLTYPPPEPFEVPECVSRAMSPGVPRHTMQNPKKVRSKRELFLRPSKRSLIRGVHFTSPDKTNNSSYNTTDSQSIKTQFDLGFLDPVCASTPFASPGRYSGHVDDSARHSDSVDPGKEYIDLSKQSTLNNFHIDENTFNKANNMHSEKAVGDIDSDSITKSYLLKEAISKVSYNLSHLNENQNISDISQNGKELCEIIKKYIDI